MDKSCWKPSYRNTLSNWPLTPLETMERYLCSYHLPDGSAPSMSKSRSLFLRDWFLHSEFGVVIKSLEDQRPLYHKYYCQEMRRNHEKDNFVTVLPLGELIRLAKNRNTTKLCGHCKKIQTKKHNMDPEIYGLVENLLENIIVTTIETVQSREIYHIIL